MDERPNILLLMTDQQRGDCLGAEGHPVLLTPNMDSIGGAGVRFARAYSTCPSCIAARRSLLVGQFPATHGMAGYRDHIEWDAPPTLPAVLPKEKYIWFVRDGREQFFDLERDPGECRDLSGDPTSADRLARWRSLLVRELEGREEGFSDGQRLIPGRPYHPILTRPMGRSER